MNSKGEKNTRLTVLMAVHNGSRYLPSAIESVLTQSMVNFEFLIIDDASRDKSCQIIQANPDPRIRLIKNKKNLGLAASLNRGLNLAKTEFIARMDDDDLCLPQRFEKQISFLSDHPQIALCGSWVKTFGRNAAAIRRYPSDTRILQSKLCFESPLAHPTVMFRRLSFQKHKLRYNAKFKRGQDFDLWDRAAKKIAMTNLPEVLLKYRESPLKNRPRIEKRTRDIESIIYTRHLKALGLKTDPKQLELFKACAQTYLSKQGLRAQEKLLLSLAQKNSIKNLYPMVEFQQELALRWYILCRLAVGKQTSLITHFRHSILFTWLPRPFYRSTALLFRHLKAAFLV